MDLEKNLLRSILIAFGVETLCVTWCLKIPGWTPFFSILYLSSGLAIAGLLLRAPAIRLPAPGKRPCRSPLNRRRLVIIGLIALMLYSWCVYWFDEFPIDVTNADMLPIIKVMCGRFIAGQHSGVYDPIPAIWHGAQPIYLPAMWLPYVPPVVMGIDMRWVAIAGLLFACGSFIFLYNPSRNPFLFGVLAFLLFWWIAADNTPGILSVSEEGVVIGYYVLLALALLADRPLLTGVAISLCMLSRYALVGWIPAYILYLALEKKWRRLSIITLTGISCFVLLFLVPVGWTTFMRLAHLPVDYIAFAARVWKDSPDVFSTAPGMAWFFGRKNIALLHWLLVGLSFTAPLLFTAITYSRSRRIDGDAPVDAVPGHLMHVPPSPGKHNLPARITRANIPLAALKLALVLFYCFIDVPYLYLFYTSSFLSLIILALVLREKKMPAV